MNETDARKKAGALVRQAIDPGVTVEEARSHALAAVRLIARHDLLGEGIGDAPGIDFGGLASPEVAEAAASIIDLVGRVRSSGLGEALKRAVGASRVAAKTVRVGGKKKTRRRG